MPGIIKIKTVRKRNRCLEQNIVKSCIEYLTYRGYEVIRNNTGRFVIQSDNGKFRMISFGKKGSPDIVACSPSGRFVAVECKKPGNKLTELQQQYLEKLKQKGAIVVIAYSVDDLIKAGL